MTGVIRPCTDQDLDQVLEVINDAALAYEGVIPPARFKDPYMPAEELRREIAHGVKFWISVDHAEHGWPRTVRLG